MHWVAASCQYGHCCGDGDGSHGGSGSGGHAGCRRRMRFHWFELLPSDAHRTDDENLRPSVVVSSTSEDLVPPKQGSEEIRSQLHFVCILKEFSLIRIAVIVRLNQFSLDLAPKPLNIPV